MAFQLVGVLLIAAELLFYGLIQRVVIRPWDSMRKELHSTLDRLETLHSKELQSTLDEIETLSNEKLQSTLALETRRSAAAVASEISALQTELRFLAQASSASMIASIGAAGASVCGAPRGAHDEG